MKKLTLIAIFSMAPLAGSAQNYNPDRYTITDEECPKFIYKFPLYTEYSLRDTTNKTLDEGFADTLDLTTYSNGKYYMKYLGTDGNYILDMFTKDVNMCPED